MAWFTGGRKYGAKVLGLLCRVSMTPQSCVVNTRNSNDRWGSAAIIITKFIPGVSALAAVCVAVRDRAGACDFGIA